MRTRGSEVPEASQPLLFDVPEQRTPVRRRQRQTAVTCSECGRPLKSERAVRAGVGTECAAKTGRAVIASRTSTGRPPRPAK
ncbi:DUF6011 domain-containing protein [Streptomyces sp. NRRL B-1347]|uniref:DUF6011 domain-containing protein n=1 Tax=Streptomyces sp. NRRL B-1347 TaxID=1476877 RepID=UPI0004CAECE7|nr:DUF6011 domain-containing protein [Streptomyces sp. NRRL B-1347]